MTYKPRKNENKCKMLQNLDRDAYTKKFETFVCAKIDVKYVLNIAFPQKRKQIDLC